MNRELNIFGVCGPNKVGGGETLREALTREAVERGWSVTWSTKGAGETRQIDGIRCQEYPPSSFPIKNRLMASSAARAVLTEMKESGISVIDWHTPFHDFGLPLAVGVLGAGLQDRYIRLVQAEPTQFFHGSKSYGRGIFRWGVHWMLGRTGSMVVSMSEYIKHQWRKSGMTGEVEVANPVPTTFATCPELRDIHEVPIVSVVSRISPEKGIDTLMKVARAAYERGISLRFLLAGPSYNDEYTHQVLSNAPPNFDWVGVKTGEELRKFYDETDILFNPSPKEAFGLVTLEALMRARPGVALNSVAREISPASDTNNPLKVLDSSSTTDTILNEILVLARPCTYQDNCRAALNVSKRFNPKHMVEKLADICGII